MWFCIPLFFVCLLEHKGEKSDSWVLQISLLKFVQFDWKFWLCEILLNNHQEHKICLLKLYSMIQGLRERGKTW
jgi:hypothetical protein